MTLYDFLICSLATWFLSYALVQLSAPFNLFGRLRTWAGESKAGNFAELLNCIYCISWWVAMFWVIIWHTEARWLMYPFALAGGALLLHRYTGSFHV